MTPCNKCRHRRGCVDGLSYVYAITCKRFEAEASRGRSIPFNIQFVGCRICGDTDVTLYKDGEKYICAACKKNVSNLGTIEEDVKC